jgi:putative transposase
MLYVGELSPSQLQELKDFAKTSKNPRLYKRAQVVLLSHKGYKAEEIAQIVDFSRERVRYWINRYRREGLEGLKDKERSGRPPKLQREHIQYLLNIKQRSPIQCGYTQREWTGRLLAEQLQNNFGVKVCDERIRQILRNVKETV